MWSLDSVIAVSQAARSVASPSPSQAKRAAGRQRRSVVAGAARAGDPTDVAALLPFDHAARRRRITSGARARGINVAVMGSGIITMSSMNIKVH